MAAEVRDLAFTIKAIDSASGTVDEIAAKLERATENQARSVANAQRQIAAIIARGDPAKAQAVALEKELSQLKSYGERAKASEETIAQARRKILEDFERNRAAITAKSADAVVASTGNTKQALSELKGSIGDLGQFANNLAGEFDATGQKVTGLVQSLVGSFASGGPVALAIGGTIALIGVWKSELDDIKKYVADAAKAAQDAQQAYNSELDQTLSRLREEKEIRGAEASGGSKKSLELGRTKKGAEELAASRVEQMARIDAQIQSERGKLDSVLADPNAGGKEAASLRFDATVKRLETERAELQKQYAKELEVAKLAGEAYDAEIADLEAKRTKLAQTATATPARVRSGGKTPAKTDRSAELAKIDADMAFARQRRAQDNEDKLRGSAWDSVEQVAKAEEDKRRAEEKAAADRQKLLKDSAAEKLRSDEEMAKAAAEALQADQEAFAQAGQMAAETFAQGFKAAMDGQDTRSIIRGVLQGVAGIASVIPGGQAVGIGAGLVSQFLRSGGPVLPQGRGGLATAINNDGIPAVLHPNEFVFDSESVNAAGGIGRLEALRRDLRSGSGRGGGGGSGATVNVVAFDQGTMLDAIGKAVEPAQYRRLANRQGSKAREAARKAASKPRSGF